MFQAEFDAGGPVMYLVFAAWVVVLAGVTDRLLYACARIWRRPMAKAARLASSSKGSEMRLLIKRERRRADRGLVRIDAMSQIATSIGLFGTVLGITFAFFGHGGNGLAAPELLSSGLGTALYTTVAGLIVFLFGQSFLIVYGEWLSFNERHVIEMFEDVGRP